MLLVEGVKTYSNREALDELARLAGRVAKAKAIVEVGVYRGGSLKTIADAAKAHVWGIDTWGLEGAYSSGSESPTKYGIANMEAAKKLLAGCENVTLTRAFSADAARAWDGPAIGMLYVDAEHTYDAVLADFAAWLPHLASKAVVAFDDCTDKPEHAGVRRAVVEIAAEYLGPLSVRGNRLGVARLR